MNTSWLGGDEAQRLMSEEARRLGLPVADPMRGGAELAGLVDGCLG